MQQRRWLGSAVGWWGLFAAFGITLVILIAAAVLSSRAVTAIVTFVLVGITGFYAWRTHDLATLAADTLEESKQQRYDQVRPFLVFSSSSRTMQGDNTFVSKSSIGLANKGVGPAAEVRLEYEPRRTRPFDPDSASPSYSCQVTHVVSAPLVLSAGETTTLRLVDHAMNPLRISWIDAEQPPGLVVQRYGVLVAHYKDIYGHPFRSTAVLNEAATDMWLLPTQVEQVSDEAEGGH